MGNCSSSSSVHPPSNGTIRSQNQITSDPALNRDQNHEDTPTIVNFSLNQDQINIQTDLYLERAKHEFEIKYAEPSVKTAKIEDFQIERTIARGSFAHVMLVKHNNQLLILKIMEKQSIVEFDRVEKVLSEKRILHTINCPFIVNLIYAFKDNACLYLTLEFVSGGELFSNLQKVIKYSEDQACFYAGQIVLALEYLHYLNIIYRNIKPEQVLFAADGYLKLIDFGFAKVVQDRTYTLCGTPEYLAPEIITGAGHNKSVDYWALGILIYEMTTGSTPFAAEDPMQSYKKILHGKFQIPDYFSSNLTDLICKFLALRPSERYGCLESGTKDIKTHKWFSSIDWIALSEKRLQAPVIPKDDKDFYKHYDEKPLASAETILYPTEFDSF